MPNKLKTVCRYPGCSKSTRNTWCEEHARESSRPRNVQRPTAHARGYDHAWRRIRNRYIKANPFCEVCDRERNKIVMRNLEVDHVIPIEQRPDLRLDWNNLQTLCRKCHARKTQND